MTRADRLRRRALTDFLTLPQPAGALAAGVARWTAEDWQAARPVIEQNGLGPWLHHRLAGVPAAEPRLAALAAYVAECRALNERRMAIWQQQLERVLAAAHPSGIRVLPIKGAALVPHYQHDPALRPTADIDLLVRPDDVPRLASCLLDLDYELAARTQQHDSYYYRPIGNLPRDLHGESPQNPLRVEIHPHADRAFGPFSLDVTDLLWDGARPAAWWSAEAWLARPAAILLHVAAHLAYDAMQSAGRFCQLLDLEVITPRLEDADWDEAVAASRRLGMDRFLAGVLMMGARLTVASVPDAVWRRLEGRTPRRLARRLRDAPYSDWSGSVPRTLAERLGVRMAWTGGAGEILHAAWRTLVPSRRQLARVGVPGDERHPWLDRWRRLRRRQAPDVPRS